MAANCSGWVRSRNQASAVHCGAKSFSVVFDVEVPSAFVVVVVVRSTTCPPAAARPIRPTDAATRSASAFLSAARKAEYGPLFSRRPRASQSRTVRSATPARRAAYFRGTPAATASQIAFDAAGSSFGVRPGPGLRAPTGHPAFSTASPSASARRRMTSAYAGSSSHP